MRRIVMVMALVACGGRSGPLTVQNEAAADANAPTWVRSPDATARTLAVAAVAAGAWGGARAVLDGWAIILTDADLPTCMDQSAGAWGYRGCTDSDARTVTVRLDNAPCPEMTVLPHEMGHVVLGGDANHDDPRWCDPAFWAGMNAALLADTEAGSACAYVLGATAFVHDLNAWCHR